LTDVKSESEVGKTLYARVGQTPTPRHKIEASASAYERCAIYTICRLAMTITVTVMKPGEFKMISCRNE